MKAKWKQLGSHGFSLWRWSSHWNGFEIRSCIKAGRIFPSNRKLNASISLPFLFHPFSNNFSLQVLKWIKDFWWTNCALFLKHCLRMRKASSEQVYQNKSFKHSNERKCIYSSLSEEFKSTIYGTRKIKNPLRALFNECIIVRDKTEFWIVLCMRSTWIVQAEF